MDGGDWQATVHGVAKSQTRLSELKKKKKKKNRLKIHEKFSITFKPGSCQHLPSFKLCRSGKRDMNWMNRRESDTVSTFALHNALGRPSIPPATHDLAATSPRSWIYIPERKKMIKKKEIKKKRKKEKKKHLNIIKKQLHKIFQVQSERN